MEGNVVFHESRNEVVVMVVTGMTTQGQWLISRPASGFKVMRQQFSFKKLIVQPLIDQDTVRERSLALAHEQTRIVLCPLRLVAAEVVRERFLTPWTQRWSGDRGKGRNRFEDIGMTQCQCQRTMPTHGVAKDADTVSTSREFAQDQFAQFLYHE